MKQLTLSDMKGSKQTKRSPTARNPPVVTPTEKIRRETKVPTSQELAKDPGPKQQQQQRPEKNETINARVLKKSYSLKYFAGIASMAVDGPAGSEVLKSWRDEFPNHFLEPAQHYAAPMQHDDPTTWEQAAETVFNFCQTMDKFEKSLYWSWDRENFGKEQDETDASNQWNIRRFSEAIASQDPTVLFDIKAKNFKDGYGTSLLRSKYWDNSNWYNPKLLVDSHVLAQLWILCATTLGHPWTASQERDVDGVFQWRTMKKKAVQESKMRKRSRLHDEDSGRSQAPHAPTTPEKPSAFQMHRKNMVATKDQDVDMTEAELQPRNFTSLVARTVDAIKGGRQSMERAWTENKKSDGDEAQDQSIDDGPVQNRHKKRVQILEEEEDREDTKPASTNAAASKSQTFEMGPLVLQTKSNSRKVWSAENHTQEEIDESSSEENQWTDDGIIGPPQVKGSKGKSAISALCKRQNEGSHLGSISQKALTILMMMKTQPTTTTKGIRTICRARVRTRMTTQRLLAPIETRLLLLLSLYPRTKRLHNWFN